MKKGISMIVLTVAISVMVVLITSSVIVGSTAIKTAQYEEFLSQVSRTADSVNQYIVKNEKLPTDGTIVSGNSLGENFLAELKTKNDLNNKLYLIDVNLLEDATIKRGQGTVMDKNVFVVAENTNNVYYIKGFKYKGKVYFGLKSEVYESKSKELGYVTDGIVLHYDGVLNTKMGHNANSSVWNDLSGNENDGILKNFNLNNTNNWKSNSLYINGKNWVESSKKNLTSFTNSDFTINIVFKSYGSYTGPCILGTGQWKKSGFYIQFRENDNMAMNVNQSGDSQGLWLTNEIITSNTQSLTYVRSGNKLRSYYNNKNISNSTNVVDLEEAQYPLRINMNVSDIEVEIMSVKVYNVALTTEELTKNYKIDKSRFNIVD